MISVYSRIALVLTLVTGLLCFISYHQDMGIIIPYFSSVIGGIVIALSVLLILRTNLRWQAIYKARNITGYNIGKAGWSKSVFHEVFHWIFYLFISWFILIYYKHGYPIVILLLFFILESLLHLLFGIKSYKIILEDNFITMINNNVLIISWGEIKGIVKRHNDLQFILRNNTLKVLDLDYLELTEREELNNKIKNIAIQKDIFIDG